LRPPRGATTSPKLIARAGREYEYFKASRSPYRQPMMLPSTPPPRG
jgi:hypothetical protein